MFSQIYEDTFKDDTARYCSAMRHRVKVEAGIFCYSKTAVVA
jgi:hypothetical protein